MNTCRNGQRTEQRRPVFLKVVDVSFQGHMGVIVENNQFRHKDAWFESKTETLVLGTVQLMRTVLGRLRRNIVA